ncbi:class B sortase [Carnobacteriaceae bacterium zg-ZUI240]|nr:class B sortase [Carnobacteriaceae bacterium zg-ZUI240]
MPNDKIYNQTHVRLQRQIHENSNVYGWIRIDGTPINYPIAQHSFDDTFYLSHDIDGEQTIYGAIFTERVNTKTFNDAVTIVYGHAMRDGSMFGSLRKFSESAFFDKYKEIIIHTIDDSYVYEILAIHLFTDDNLYEKFQLDTPYGRQHYLDTLPDTVSVYGGMYRPYTVDVSKDKLLILSTCDVNDTQRYIVTAKLVKKEQHK